MIDIFKIVTLLCTVLRNRMKLTEHGVFPRAEYIVQADDLSNFKN